MASSRKLDGTLTIRHARLVPYSVSPPLRMTEPMSSLADSGAGTGPEQPAIHPLYVRVTHWINAVAILIMIGSGWQIYNASPLFTFTFPSSLTLGGWLAGGLLWHFAAMWLLIANGLVYLTVGLATGRLRRKLLPIRPREVIRDLAAALTGRLEPRRPHRLQRVQKMLYVVRATCRCRHRPLRPCTVEARAAAGSWRRCAAATRAPGSCISSPWPSSSCSSLSMSSWRSLSLGACVP